MTLLTTTKGLTKNTAFVFLMMLLTLSIPFAVNVIFNGDLKELSKSVFSLYLIAPLSCFLFRDEPNYIKPLISSIVISIAECLEWRLFISQQTNEIFRVVINPQWLLIAISFGAMIYIGIRFFKHGRHLWAIFAIIMLTASITSTYSFHYLVINRGITQAVSDHQDKMKLIDTSNPRQTAIICSVLRLTCLQSPIDEFQKMLNKHELDKNSVLAINAYARDNNVFYAWRETDIISAALNGNGILLGYINKNNTPMIVVDKEAYSVRMNREESLFMYLVIIFHAIWIPGWILVSIKHKNIRINYVSRKTERLDSRTASQ